MGQFEDPLPGSQVALNAGMRVGVRAGVRVGVRGASTGAQDGPKRARVAESRNRGVGFSNAGEGGEGLSCSNRPRALAGSSAQVILGLFAEVVSEEANEVVQ